jgi:hypothetical protein
MSDSFTKKVKMVKREVILKYSKIVIALTDISLLSKSFFLLLILPTKINYFLANTHCLVVKVEIS